MTRRGKLIRKRTYVMIPRLPYVTVDQLMAAEDDYDNDVLIGVPAIAEYTGVAPRVLERWIRRHHFPVFRFGPQDRGPWYAHVYAIDGWILERRRKAHATAHV
jgi:hypothetical protein